MNRSFLALALVPLFTACPTATDKPECAEGADCGDEPDDTDTDVPDTGDSPDTDADADTDGDTDADTDSDTDTDTTEDTGEDTGDTTDTDTRPCRVRIDSTLPAAGAMDFYYRSAIEVELSDRDPTARITASFAGTSTLSSDRETITFQPDAPLAPDTDYTFTVEGCFGSADIDFRTSAFGTPMADTSVLVGATWSLELGSGRVTAPEGLGSVLAAYITQDTLFGVTAVDAANLDGIFADAVERAPGEQDLTHDTLALTGFDFSAAPYFSYGPANLSVMVDGVELSVDSFEMTGTFSADGTAIGGVTLAGIVDTRPLAPLVDTSGDEGVICDLSVSFGASCQACASDGEPYCLPFEMDQVTAAEVPGLTLVAVTDGDDIGSGMCATATAVLPLGWAGLLLAARRQRRREA